MWKTMDPVEMEVGPGAWGGKEGPLLFSLLWDADENDGSGGLVYFSLYK